MDKCDTKTHYVIFSVDRFNLVLYYFDGGGRGSTLLQHWIVFPKIPKNVTKNEV